MCVKLADATHLTPLGGLSTDWMWVQSIGIGQMLRSWGLSICPIPIDCTHIQSVDRSPKGVRCVTSASFMDSTIVANIIVKVPEQ
jgi:hypothetical protein